MKLKEAFPALFPGMANEFSGARLGVQLGIACSSLPRSGLRASGQAEGPIFIFP
jgi:hypothetical protein